MTIAQDALDYHAQGRPGKIQVLPTKPFRNQRDLSLAYTPGVAEPCRAIAALPDDVYRYTARGNLVAVVSNGTAVLGLGNIGPLAGKPVMEGKGILFKAFADIDVFDLEIDAPTPADVIRFCQMLEPTVGGINLEDVRSPDCFVVEERLRESLDIPVFHDDQHGTAIITGAALLNALEVVGKAVGDVRVVFAGAGAAALATAEHYVKLGVRREQIVLCDEHGTIHDGREDLTPYAARFARRLRERTLAQALIGADVFVGLSVGGIVTREMIRRMATRPIVFALANPVPEITPGEVAAERPDAVIATGRSDYPNQVNNVLGFPFIFRGALDVRARAINDDMKMAATQALVALAREDVPDVVMRAYGLERLRFGPEYLIPKPFDPRVLLWVAPAVASAAVSSGVARATIDPEQYRAALDARFGRARELMRGFTSRASRDAQRVVFSDGDDPMVQRAAAILGDERIAAPILVGDPEAIHQTSVDAGITLDDVTVRSPHAAPELERYARHYWERRQRKGVTLRTARERMHHSAYFATMMVELGDADAAVLGEAQNYPEAVRPAFEIVGVEAERGTASGIYMIVAQNEVFFFADCTVHIDPDAETLAVIAWNTAHFVWHLGIEPRVALLSFSNFGSARHPESSKVAHAVRLLHERHPELAAEGEMQADTAVVDAILKQRYPFARLRGPANVLIFPNLSAANIAYKLLSRIGGAEAIGPILVGLGRPIHVLQRDSAVTDIINLAVIAAVDAQERRRHASATGK